MDAVMRRWRFTLGVVGMLLANVVGVRGQFAKEWVIEECSLSCDVGTPLFADFDGDGDTDITFSYPYSNQISWYEKLTNGTFQKKIIKALDFYNQFVCVVDLDKDSDADIITAGQDGKIFWYRNNGQGEFTQQSIADTRYKNDTEYYESIASLQVIDCEGDGDLDVLAYLSSYGSLTWYVNSGTYTFVAEEAAKEDWNLNSISALNLDDDKEIEITFFDPYSNQQLGYFDKIGQNYERRVVAEKPLGLWVRSIFYKDLDGDAKIDMVFSTSIGETYNPSQIVYIKNEGRNSFASSRIVLKNDEIHEIAIEDLNQDGTVEIIAFGVFGKQINIFTKNAQNIYALQTSLPINRSVEYANTLQVADANKDGLLDVLIGSDIFSYVGCYYNQKNWNFKLETLGDSKLNGLVNAFAIDLDGDKKNEILAGSSEIDPAEFVIYKNDGKQNITSLQSISFANLGGMTDFVPFDVDDDDRAEILFTGVGQTKLGWFEYEKKDSFPNIKRIDFGTESLANLCTIDLDGDQNEDIVASVINLNKLVWFRNEGNGQYSEKKSLAINLGNIRSLQVADVNNDGINDLIIHVPERLFWLLNSGEGFFYAPETIRWFRDKYTLSYQAIDLDKDGDQDLLLENNDTGSGLRLEWLENNGQGEFLEPKAIFDYNLRNPYRSIEFGVGDVDNDGDYDLVFSNVVEADGRLFWVENQGEAVFSKPAFIALTLGRIKKIQLTDLDADADLDILLTYDDDILSWFENRISKPNISGVAFWDKNANGKFDPDESIIKNLPIQLTPSTTSTFTGSDGKYRFYVPDGRYRISVQPDECWQLTTDSLSYTVNIVGNVSLNKNFGFQLVPKAQAVHPRLSSGPTRCGFDVPFVLSVHNEGCVPSKGMFGLVRSPLAKYLGASIFPDRVKGDTLLWNYSTLVGTAAQQLRLNFQIAGTDFLGDTIHIKTLAYFENPQGQLQLAGTYDYRSEIRCAYDPNDKLTFPNRRSAYPRNYTLFKEEMEFLVRFQNTGNDTAFTVVIRDTLNKNLDWSTFRPLAGSHPFETHIQENGALSFTFKNILLPDSKTNEPLSHGFVSYRVSPKLGLSEQTEILNTAYIYFDFNPPIQTNTTSNVMVSSLPRLTGTRALTNDFPHRVYPNPFQQQLWFELGMPPQGQGYTLTLYNAQAQLVHSQLIVSKLTELNTAQMTKGLYWYLLKDSQGHMLTSGKIMAQ